MRKILSITCSLFLFLSYLHAQPKIEKSEIFEEPLSEGWTKLMLLKNGNTFYFHYGGKKGIEEVIFGKNKKKIGSHTIEGKNWNARRKILVKICGAYEINNEPVIFLAYYGAKFPVLCRLRINPLNGTLISEELVGDKQKKFYMRDMRNIEKNQNICVEKDAESDNYAVVFYNGQSKDLDEKIKVLHFDGSHKLINMAYYDSPDPNIKHLNFIGAVVDGNKRVYISTYGTESEKGKNAHVFIARLNLGDSVFQSKTLDFSEDFMNTNSDMVYNRSNNTLVMLTNTLAESKRNSKTYVSFISYIDPENLTLKGVNLAGSEKVNAYAHGTLGLDNGYSFTGLPQKLVLNPDNTLSVLQEELTFKQIVNAKTGSTVAEYTYMGNIGITEMGTDGLEKKGYVMMKSQQYYGRITPFYMAGRSKGLWVNQIYSRGNSDDNSFMSYEYIHTANANYVLFNDNPKNDKKDEDEGRRKLTENTDFINTICYTIKDGIAKRSYLFGEPIGKKNTRACYIDASHYDKASNTYTTVVSEQHGRKYDSRVAWIHFE